MKVLDSSFTGYELSDAEQAVATQYTDIQRKYLQTLLSEVAHTKLNLPFTPNDPLSYAQQEAYLKGKLDLLQSLLYVSTGV